MSFRNTQVARFHELEAQREAILAKVEPLYAELKALVAEERDSKVLREKIKELKAPLFDIDQERAFLARGLKTLNNE